MLQLVKFGAEWCGPCKKLAPVFAEVAEVYAGKVTTFEVDVDKSADVASRYNVMSVPTVVLIKDGQTVARKSGTLTWSRLTDMIEAHLS